MPNEYTSTVVTRPPRETHHLGTSEISPLADSQALTVNMDTSSRNVLFKIIIDVILLGIPAIIALLLFIFVEPFHRGFFCFDESLIHPFKPDTITTLALAIGGIIIGIVLILIVEFIRVQRNSDARDKTTVIILNRSVPLVAQKLYQYIGIFLFILSVNQFLTDASKYAVGRLRPHFYDVCLPRMRDGSTCNDTQNHHRYIENFICTNRNSTDHMLNNMRLSFPSGHSSFAFAAAVFCVLYIQARVTWRGSKLFKHFLQLLFISAATFTGLSRISDYKHHWSDVFGGSILGAAVALLGIYASDIFKKPSISKKNESNGESHQV